MNRETEVGWFLTQESFGRGGSLEVITRMLILTPEERLRVSAWQHACPRPREVSCQYGMDKAISRYNDCDEFTREIWRRARKKPFLYWALTTPTRREPGEPVGKFEPVAVPESHLQTTSPLSNFYNYALSRVAIEAAGRDEERSAEKCLQAFELLEEAIATSSDPIEMLSKFSEAVVRSGVHPVKILGHVLAEEILPEENCHLMYQQVINDLRVNAPTVWECYCSLTPEERSKNGIINF